MFKRNVSTTIVLFVLLCFGLQSMAQTITYSKPDEEDIRANQFEILGKKNGKLYIYKNAKRNHAVHVYNLADMHLENKITIPNPNDDIADIDVLTTPQHYYFFYQKIKKNIASICAIKFNIEQAVLDTTMVLDTVHLQSNESVSKKLFKVVVSDNKNFITFIKLYKADKQEQIWINLFNKQLTSQYKRQFALPYNNRNHFLSEFNVDNDGNLIFLQVQGSAQNDNITKVECFQKLLTADSLSNITLPTDQIYLDDVKVKVDNYTKHYLFHSFYATKKRGDVDGLWFASVVWNDFKHATSKNILLKDDIRNLAKGDNSTKTAFNDYYIKQIIPRNDGGFIVIAEMEYVKQRNNTYNRWDNLSSSSNWGYMNDYAFNYPYSSWNRNNDLYNTNRYFSENIFIASYLPSGESEWMNIVNKSQYDDNTDQYLGFGICNTNENLVFIFNSTIRGNFVLTQQPLSINGDVDRPMIMKNIDKGFDFLPKNVKQVGKKQIIIPCMYRNILCFAKIDFE